MRKIVTHALRLVVLFNWVGAPQRTHRSPNARDGFTHQRWGWDAAKCIYESRCRGGLKPFFVSWEILGVESGGPWARFAVEFDVQKENIG